MQDKFTHVTHSTSRLMDQTLHDAHNRWSGLQASAMRMFSQRQAKPIDDHVLEARVRSRLGRAMSHMRDVEVHAHQGAVTLSGHLDNEEQNKVLALVAAMPGVESVNGPPQSHAEGAPVSRDLSPLWIAGATGAGLFAWYALTRRQPLGLLAAVTGLGLMSGGGTRARGGTVPLGNRGRSGYQVERTIEIAAAPDVVFDIWSRHENFPHFMSQVTEVRDLGQSRSHWIVQGPHGQDVEWDSVLTVSERPHRLAWRSEPNTAVDHEGVVLLEPAGEGTRATVRLFWRPPAGSTGEALMVLSGTDPEGMLQDDLHRMKEFIERGLSARGEPGGVSGETVLH